MGAQEADNSFGASLVAQRLKHLPAMRETWVRSLGREDVLEKEMATHSSILAWRIPWAEEPGGLQSWGHRVGHDFTFTFTIFYNDQKVIFLLMFPEGTYMKFKCLSQHLPPHQPAHFLNKKGLQTSTWNQKLAGMRVCCSLQ